MVFKLVPNGRTLSQQYNDLVVRLLPIYREGSVVAGDAVRYSNYADVEFAVKVSENDPPRYHHG